MKITLAGFHPAFKHHWKVQFIGSGILIIIIIRNHHHHDMMTMTICRQLWVSAAGCVDTGSILHPPHQLPPKLSKLPKLTIFYTKSSNFRKNFQNLRPRSCSRKIILHTNIQQNFPNFHAHNFPPKNTKFSQKVND